MITFVTHYIQLDSVMIEKIKEARSTYAYPNFIYIDNPEAILDALFGAIKKFHPDAELIILTDNMTHLKVNPSIKIIRYPMETKLVEYESLKAKLTFLKKTTHKSHVIFLEWDMLIQKPLDSIFNDDSDIYFTIRNVFPMPFNDGLIAIKRDGISSACRLLEFFLSKYENFSSNKYKSWYGFQLILKMLFLPAFIKIKPKEYSDLKMTFQGTKIGFLDGNIYNFYPVKTNIKEYYPEPKVIHFAKENKVAMLYYYKTFIKDKA